MEYLFVVMVIILCGLLCVGWIWACDAFFTALDRFITNVFGPPK